MADELSPRRRTRVRSTRVLRGTICLRRLPTLTHSISGRGNQFAGGGLIHYVTRFADRVRCPDCRNGRTIRRRPQTWIGPGRYYAIWKTWVAIKHLDRAVPCRSPDDRDDQRRTISRSRRRYHCPYLSFLLQPREGARASMSPLTLLGVGLGVGVGAEPPGVGEEPPPTFDSQRVVEASRRGDEVAKSIQYSWYRQAVPGSRGCAVRRVEVTRASHPGYRGDGAVSLDTRPNERTIPCSSRSFSRS